MGQIYYFLGLSVACLTHEQAFLYDPEYTSANLKIQDSDKTSGDERVKLDEARDITGGFKVIHEFLRPVPRKEAYLADIVYGTNHEFGFDYLRDNLAYSTDQQVQLRRSVSTEVGAPTEASGVQRKHYYAIIDEVDSILIDEARTPLIISAPDVQAADYYKLFARVAGMLKKDTDYLVDEKNRSVQIVESGIDKVEKVLNLEGLYSPQNIRLVHYLEESLKAEALFSRDKRYVVKNGEVIIVDEFTGRLMPGRRYSGGLHQAIEAKEGVRVQEESKTFAQITLQNYFKLYEKISGMTGTAKTSSEEFEKVYGLEVVSVPTNKPRVRNDYPDLIFKGREIKYREIVSEVKKKSERGQPVLVGTTSIDENELLSSYFSQSGIKHEVLNAKNHEREGEIIAQAGKKGGVTLATNMAGRGVDIVLGGSPQDLSEAEEIKKLGGLFVMGTNRHEARRIDNQLRGRCGRQGDPGETQFFLSLEDDLLRIFGGERVQNIMTRFNLPENEPIQSSLVSKVVDEAQKKVEGINFDVRKHLLEYDTVLNRQRQTVYRRRQNILERIERGEIKDILEEIVLNVLGNIFKQEVLEDNFKKWMTEVGLVKDPGSFSAEEIEMLRQGNLPEFIRQRIEEVISSDDRAGLKVLASLDTLWTDHLENLEALLEGVRIRAYGQKDPLVEYKREGFEMFQNLVANAETLALVNVFKTQTVTDTTRTVPKNSQQLSVSGQRQSVKIGRNDPCWCGAKKPDGTPVKFKHCHGK